MIISKLDFLYRSHLDQQTLELWIAEEWLVPQGPETEPGFSEADVARAALIHELQEDLGVNAEGVGVILNLLDQMHSLRSVLATTLRSSRDHTRSASE